MEKAEDLKKKFCGNLLEIINGLIKNPYQRRLTNAIAESNNNYIHRK